MEGGGDSRQRTADGRWQIADSRQQAAEGGRRGGRYVGTRLSKHQEIQKALLSAGAAAAIYLRGWCDARADGDGDGDADADAARQGPCEPMCAACTCNSKRAGCLPPTDLTL